LQFEIKRRSQAMEYKYLLKALERERPRRSHINPHTHFSAATIHNNNFLPQFLAALLSLSSERYMHNFWDAVDVAPRVGVKALCPGLV
jgi:hypothetical protein